MYICCKIRGEEIFDLKKFEVMDNAVLDFMIGTGFDKSLGEWVDEAGFYVCNDGDYGDKDFGEVIKLVINMKSNERERKYGQLSDYDEEQYVMYYEKIKKHIRNKKIENLLK